MTSPITSTRAWLLLAVVGTALATACSTGSAAPPIGAPSPTRAPATAPPTPSPTTPGAPTAGPSASTGDGTLTQEENGAGSVFVTPTPGGSTPALRYAWCLREKGLPAVVIEGNVAMEDSPNGTGKQTGGALGKAESECAAKHPDYTPPNLNQR